jgi:hypothetical protein
MARLFKPQLLLLTCSAGKQEAATCALITSPCRVVLV